LQLIALKNIFSLHLPDENHLMKEKEVTIYDIAQSLHISPATVSRGLKDHPAISKKTKKLITDTARQMGYRSNTFASNLRRQKTNTVGVIVPRLNSSFMSDALAGMEKIANNSGYNLIIAQSLETEKKEILNATTLFNNRVDGLIISLSYDTKNIDHLEPFLNKGIPVLFFDRVYTHKNCSTITIDNHKAAYDITTHLISQGCKKLLHVTGNLSRNVYSERYRGFMDAIEHHGLTFPKENLIIHNLTPENGIETARNLLKNKKLPDGVLITNDLCAAHCMQELKNNGIRIPKDIAIAGFNNDPIAHLIDPPLTTISYKGSEMGEIVMQTMINQLNQTQNISVTQSIVLSHELMIRKSSLKKTD
jgi:LacI family transcriptional regulator